MTTIVVMVSLARVLATPEKCAKRHNNCKIACTLKLVELYSLCLKVMELVKVQTFMPLLWLNLCLVRLTLSWAFFWQQRQNDPIE